MIEHYKAISCAHKFRDFNCNRISDAKACGFEMFHFETSNSDKPPDFNILEKAVFHTKRPYDCYSLNPYLQINTGIMVSSKFFDLLSDLSMPPFIDFPDIKVYNDGTLLNYHFIYFYMDFTKKVIFEKSNFILINDDYFSLKLLADKNTQLAPESTIDISSLDDYKTKKAEYKKNLNLTIIPNELFIPQFNQYDIISMNRGLYFGLLFSNGLQKEIKKNKISGINYWGNVYFDFIC